MTEKPQGLLSNLLGQLSAAGVKTPPIFTEKSITIVITQPELAEMMLKGIKSEHKDAISLAIKEGKVEIAVKLW